MYNSGKQNYNLTQFLTACGSLLYPQACHSLAWKSFWPLKHSESPNYVPTLLKHIGNEMYTCGCQIVRWHPQDIHNLQLPQPEMNNAMIHIPNKAARKYQGAHAACLSQTVKQYLLTRVKGVYLPSQTQ